MPDLPVIGVERYWPSESVAEGCRMEGPRDLDFICCVATLLQKPVSPPSTGTSLQSARGTIDRYVINAYNPCQAYFRLRHIGSDRPGSESGPRHPPQESFGMEASLVLVPESSGKQRQLLQVFDSFGARARFTGAQARGSLL